MASSDAEWDRLRPLIKAKNDETFFALRDAYRAGIPKSFRDADIAAAKALFKTLAEYGGRDLIGESPVLAPGTFWSGYRY
jgi:NitT/TauT family transport system substrate-binding protein